MGRGDIFLSVLPAPSITPRPPLYFVPNMKQISISFRDSSLMEYRFLKFEIMSLDFLDVYFFGSFISDFVNFDILSLPFR